MNKKENVKTNVEKFEGATINFLSESVMTYCNKCKNKTTCSKKCEIWKFIDWLLDK